MSKRDGKGQDRERGLTSGIPELRARCTARFRRCSRPRRSRCRLQSRPFSDHIKVSTCLGVKTADAVETGTAFMGWLRITYRCCCRRAPPTLQPSACSDHTCREARVRVKCTVLRRSGGSFLVPGRGGSGGQHSFVSLLYFRGTSSSSLVLQRP